MYASNAVILLLQFDQFSIHDLTSTNRVGLQNLHPTKQMRINKKADYMKNISLS